MAERGMEEVSLSRVGIARLVVGLVQAVALYLLIHADQDKAWPASEPALFAALVLNAAYIPLIVLAGLSSLRRTSLAVWTLMAIGFLTALAVHDILRETDVNQNLPSFPVFVFAAAALFIAHHLVVAADVERKLIASYPAYFDAAWKDAVQLAFSLGYVGAFWLLLELGTALFEMIGLDFLTLLVREDWFYIPATTLMFAAAVHLTDVRVDLIRGVRTVGLALLSWLLSVMTVIAVGFLAALPFTGLKPLWDTGYATALLLGSAAALIILINATYQDGAADRKVPRILRYTARAAALALIPLVAMAGYALSLRIDQHGLTPDRIIAIACVVVGICYTAGYALAAVSSGRFLKPLEATNIFAAFVVLAGITALFTPIADPARIAVADQVRRLEEGKISPQEFDFKFLRFDGARYGKAALAMLKEKKDGADAALIASKAEEALKVANRWENVVSTVDLADRITVYPREQTLPASFLQQDWSKETSYMPCLSTDDKCDAFFADLNGDGTSEILLMSAGNWLNAFASSSDGTWTLLGTLTPIYCPGLPEALREGRYASVAPDWNDLDVGGQRLRLDDTGTCASAVEPAPPVPTTPGATIPKKPESE